MNARTLAVLGTTLVLAACSGNKFGANAEPLPAEGGGSNEGGKSGSGQAGESSSGADNALGGEENGGATPGSSGSSLGGAGPGAGGSDEGGAGEPAIPMQPVFTASKLVDDMEDGNATLLASNGDWFVFKDKTAGTITPPKEEPFKMTTLVPARGASTKAASVTVSGFTGWGAAFGFDFSYAMAVRRPNDLGPALAVRFWAKASKATTVRLQIPNGDTDAEGGKCTTGDNACGAHWSTDVKLETEWKQTTVLFADLEQNLPGRHVPTFDKQSVYSTFFVIGPNQSVTLWVDDLELVH